MKNRKSSTPTRIMNAAVDSAASVLSRVSQMADPQTAMDVSRQVMSPGSRSAKSHGRRSTRRRTRSRK
jgi:hypothetical protein